ncbi:hypothetical protein ACFYNO_04270 [Kitasatospora sp. NPDC006697]|uniref:hypothetical protein n=1 Tax=Kitasatospora sp. NPDC006697 TaxID=3364020 RepID=UPI0036B95AC1
MHGLYRLLRWLGLAVLAAAAAAGCAGQDAVHDAGAARPLTQHPSPVALWPAAETVRSPAAGASAAPPAGPIPGLTVPGDSIRAADPGAVLAADPDLPAAERAALHGCSGCTVYQAQYPDLTGDGQEELVTAVRAADQHSYLHVYRLREHQVLPLLAVVVEADFRAERVGHNLVLTEPTGAGADSPTTYQWNPSRDAFDRRTAAGGPGGAAGCLPGAVPTPGPSKGTEASPSAVPSAAPGARVPGRPTAPATGPPSVRVQPVPQQSSTPGRGGQPSPAPSPPPPSGAVPSSVPSPVPSGAGR